MTTAPGVAPFFGVEEDTSKFSADAVADLEGVDIAMPTRFIPGSESKQLLMYLRLCRGLQLHVEGDRDDHTKPDQGEHQYNVVFGSKCVFEDDGCEYED